MTFLIFGAKGWIAGQLYKLLQKQGKPVVMTETRMEDRHNVMRFEIHN